MSNSEQYVPPDRILRYRFPERLNHWIASFSYIYLLLTGLAFWSPWLFWLAVILGGAPVSRMLHPWVGLIFVAAVFQMYSMWASQMHTTEVDKVWWRSIRFYVQNKDDKMPPAGKYNAGQKILFWTFLWCGILLLLTGLILWFPEYIPWNLRFLRLAAVFIHPAVALITIGNFLIHIYMSVFAERGALDSMVHGDVSKEFVARYHPGWYEEVTGETPPHRE